MAPILTSAQVQQLDKTSLFEFLSLRMAEGSQIDYKEDLSGETKNEKYKEIPVLMISTEAEDEKVNTARKAGAKGYLIKPFTNEELIKFINESI